MSHPEKYAKCSCTNCGGHIEFPSEGAGRTIPCPHCHFPTLLELPVERVPIGGGPAARRQIFRSFFIATAIVILAGAGLWWRVYKRQHAAAPAPAANQPANGAPTASPGSPLAPVVVKPKPPPDPWHGLMAGPVKIEKSADGRLIYAVGQLHNASDHERFGVKVELDVFNADNEKVGTATDYAPSIDVGKDWKFRAMIIDRTARKAKLISVKEEN